MWEKNLRENGYMYTYERTSLLYSRNDHNLVNQLYFNKTSKKNEVLKSVVLSTLTVLYDHRCYVSSEHFCHL